MKTGLLIVDDDKAMTAYLAEAIEKIGWPKDEIHTAQDGLEALIRIEAQTKSEVGFVLTDIVMPRLDGMTLVRAIKSRTDSRILQCALMTALDDPECGKQAAKFCVPVLHKPFTIDELRTKILDEWLRMRQEMVAAGI